MSRAMRRVDRVFAKSRDGLRESARRSVTIVPIGAMLPEYLWRNIYYRVEFNFDRLDKIRSGITRTHQVDVITAVDFFASMSTDILLPQIKFKDMK